MTSSALMEGELTMRPRAEKRFAVKAGCLGRDAEAVPCIPDLTADLRLTPSSAPPCSFTGVCAPTDSLLLTTVTAFVPSFTSRICVEAFGVMCSNMCHLSHGQKS